jgi:hypothetical protein
VLVKPIYRVASSRRDGEAGPGSKREAGYEEPSKCDQCMLIGGPGDREAYMRQADFFHNIWVLLCAARYLWKTGVYTISCTFLYS